MKLVMIRIRTLCHLERKQDMSNPSKSAIEAAERLLQFALAEGIRGYDDEDDARRMGNWSENLLKFAKEQRKEAWKNYLGSFAAQLSKDDCDGVAVVSGLVEFAVSGDRPYIKESAIINLNPIVMFQPHLFNEDHAVAINGLVGAKGTKEDYCMGVRVVAEDLSKCLAKKRPDLAPLLTAEIEGLDSTEAKRPVAGGVGAGVPAAPKPKQ